MQSITSLCLSLLLLLSPPGKGLGLEATCDFSTGDLILLDRPLGIAYGPRGSSPSNKNLTQVSSHAKAR